MKRMRTNLLSFNHELLKNHIIESPMLGLYAFVYSIYLRTILEGLDETLETLKI